MGHILFSKEKRIEPHSECINLSICRFLTFLYLPVLNFCLLLCPSPLTYDWQMGTVEVLEEPSRDPRTYAALVFYCLLSALALKAIIKSVAANYCGNGVRGRLPRDLAARACCYAGGGMKKFSFTNSSFPAAVSRPGKNDTGIISANIFREVQPLGF